MSLDMRKGKLASARVYQEFFPFTASDTVINIGCGAGPQAVIYRGQYQQMVGVDINAERLAQADATLRQNGITHYQTACADVEHLPLPDGVFDKALAVDVIEHVRDPQRMCSEAHRVLKPGGVMLITFPALHDHYVRLFSRIGRLLGRKSKSQRAAFDKPDEWHPDAHNQEHSVQEWSALVESCGFRLVDSRASTLFPPLHLYGVPRFWFTNPIIHRIDSALAHTRLLRNYGQALVALYEKR